MLSGDLPKLKLTDEALFGLVQARDGLRQIGPPVVPRIAISPLGVHDPQRIAWEATFLRFISVTESYVDRLLVELVGADASQSTSTDRAFFSEFEGRATRNWPARQNSYRTYAAIRMGGWKRWEELQLATRVRNCLAHGLGRLGTRERGSSSFATNVRRYLAVEVGGNRVHVSQESVDATFDLTEAFVRWLDREAS